MLSKKLKKNWEENKRVYIAAGLLVGFGFVLGAKAQRKIDVKTVVEGLKDVTMFKRAVNPMFPATMSIPEIKEALLKIDGATFADALVSTVNGTQSIHIR